ncbi:efflux RND transporter periplasmic adaptor subunit [uncultured Gilvimarinus sp.]|uniref:efflux RND transporter periplasmic adaptor subunit n=1 Tax=uncultured Gilvimarinus sp. TaxID=1689143 RepID=UPI0030D8801D
MSKSNLLKPTILAAAIGGIVLGSALTFTLSGGGSDNAGDNVNAEAKKDPLYWVAPMDPNYQRDKPGKSPMGMDLIPVYEGGKKANDAGPGTINISPDVVNNLGVRTGLAERKPLHTEIVTVGYVQYDQDKLVHIHPRVSGWIEKLYVKAAGDPVEKGGPLYSLYSPELVNAQEELVLALNRNNQRLIQASEDRLRALQIPEYFIKKLKNELKVQQTVTFYTPQNGVVDNLNIREGSFVKPGTTMLSIGALDEVWVEAEVFERQASLVKVGDPVTMTLDYLPGKKWTGKVEYIYPTLDSKTRTARIRLSFDNAARKLKPNMFAQVVVHSDSSDLLLVIPREALIRTGSQDRVVLALGDGSFKSVEVAVGRVNQTVAEIIEGLEDGEKIVTSAQFLLDSESSKVSDFKRMHHGDDVPDAVWIPAEITNLMLDHRMVTVRHEAVDVWDWPAMTMDLTVADKVDLAPLKPGTILHMEVTKRGDKEYEITATHIISNATDIKAPKNDSQDTADHSMMDHSTMNHSDKMDVTEDHSKMNHGDTGNSKIDHSKMDHSSHTEKSGE